MLSPEVKKKLKKQHYEIIGKNEHSGVQICRWTKNSLRNEGVCYKEKFYGIKSHRCCQMTPSLFCPNSCLHCWRDIKLTTGKKIPGKIDSPSEIIDSCIKAQRKLLQGFKIDKNSKKTQLSRADMEKWKEAQEPMQFAISLSGEPTIYPYIGELISELNKRGKTSFLVTNGLYPEKLKELLEKNSLPTQLYISVNAPNEKLHNKIHNSLIKDAWKKLNSSLEIMSKLGNKTRSVFRINLVRELNMHPELIKEYAQLIKKARPQLIEIKGYMAVGSARERLDYERMPIHSEIKDFSKLLSKELNNIGLNFKILDEKKESCVVVLGKNKGELKIMN